MRRSLRPAFFLTALLLATVPVAADSFVEGGIAGIELCPQSICGVAIFVGEFEGSVNRGPQRQGVFLAGINHTSPLPVDDEDTPATIIGGSFIIRLPFRTIRGTVTGGLITSNGDDTFAVDMNLDVATPSGPVQETFTGTLRHDVFPPTIEGRIN